VIAFLSQNNGVYFLKPQKALTASLSLIMFTGNPVAGVGMDLVSLNIQRGRDHGIPKYNDLRAQLQLRAAMSFADISSNPAVQQALSDAYSDDIGLVDAWVGGLAEEHVRGGMVGELFATIIGDQFTRLMYGDRFFFLGDDDLKNAKLVDKVIDVSKVTLSDILAANTDLFDFGQDENVFLTDQ
jgi:peroxidase